MSKQLVITGGTSGIGHAAVRSLISEGWLVTMLARNQAVADQMIGEFGDNLSFISCDLTDLTSVKKVASEIKMKLGHIDVLMNNAGGIVMERKTSKDGFEMSFALNHLGHFMLTTELLDLLISSNSRIINVSSAAHRLGKINFEDLQWEKRTYNSWKAYGDGKLANIYFTKELHSRFRSSGITAYSCHPGVVRTGFGTESKGMFNLLLKAAQPFMISPEKGAETQLYLATIDGIEKHSGRYFDKRKVASVAPQANELETAAHLWEVSEELVGPFR